MVTNSPDLLLLSQGRRDLDSDPFCWVVLGVPREEMPREEMPWDGKEPSPAPAGDSLPPPGSCLQIERGRCRARVWTATPSLHACLEMAW